MVQAIKRRFGSVRQACAARTKGVTTLNIICNDLRSFGDAFLLALFVPKLLALALLALALQVFQQVGRKFLAAAAADTQTRVDRQLVERIDAALRTLADLALGDCVTDTDIHCLVLGIGCKRESLSFN
jgi:hypothetical protein